MAYGVSNGHMTDDIGVFGREIGSLEKSHGIGQTPCSYEHYLVSSKTSLCGQFFFVFSVSAVMSRAVTVKILRAIFCCLTFSGRAYRSSSPRFFRISKYW